MNDIEKSRISEIHELHAEIGGYLRMTLDKAIRIGELLTEQKVGMEHGTWLPWLQENVPFSERTARDYLRFYDQREELKTATVADLTMARKHLAPPSSQYKSDYDKIFGYLLLYTWWEAVPHKQFENVEKDLAELAKRVMTYGPPYDPEANWNKPREENLYLRLELPDWPWREAYMAWANEEDPSGSGLIALGWTEEEFKVRVISTQQRRSEKRIMVRNCGEN